MRSLILVGLASLALAACAETPPPNASQLPGISTVCVQIKSDKFDTALKAYGAATDAVDLLIDAKVIVPGTKRALAVANANDKVLAAFAAAQRARTVCNATGYAAAMNEVAAGINEVRLALRR